ncbi:unnamed protein product [Clavelina lepadiformis]|uniref:Gem-associated protein 5 n=1 Tax=Clavelina lepadiformis TaxID=159417 RepID=A0ABP0G6P0_CLALP
MTMKQTIDFPLNSDKAVSPLNSAKISEHLIASGDDKGCLVVWNLEKAQHHRYYPDNLHQAICAISFSPHHQHLVAVAYRAGAISVVDINNRASIFRKFRGHGNEIHSVVWSFFPNENIFTAMNEEEQNGGEAPAIENALEDDKLIEGILVSGSKDKTIRLWSLSKGKCLKVIKLPVKPMKGRKASEDGSRLYVALHWPQDSRSKFLSSSYNGDILLWDMSKDEKDQYELMTSQYLNQGHQRVVFNINAGLDPRNNIITTSMDRHIKLWSLNEPQSPPLCSLPTLGGYVYAVTISPTDPSIVALGVGDGNIRVWKTKNPRNPFDITVLWQGVKEKVMSLAWHPSKEGRLAFGTEDGKVGLYDVLTLRAPVISESYHMKPVYAMSWGPQSYSEGSEVSNGDKLFLYTSGGEGVILMHHPTLKKDGIDIATIISATNQQSNHNPGKRSEVRWRNDGQVVAIGNDNGSFDIYQAPHLLHLVTVRVHNKIINCLAWCPVPSGHEYHCWIASGSNNSNICVTDLKNFIAPKQDTESADASQTSAITEPYRMLADHTGRITGLSWNANNPTQIASASYDGTVEVWDVCKGEGICNYRGHDGRVLCVAWSPVVDEGNLSGVIYSGADDYSVHIWRHERQENRLPPKDVQHVGFTQKQTALWKKKHKKKKSVPQSVLKSPDPVTSAEPTTPTVTPDLDELLERKKLELLAEIDVSETTASLPLTNQGGVAASSPAVTEPGTSHASTARSDLNPNAQPWKSPDRKSPDSSVKEVLIQLSEGREASQESKDGDKSSFPQRKRVNNLLPLSSALDNQKKEDLQRSCIDIVKFKRNQLNPDDEEFQNIGFYGDRMTAYRMLAREDRHLARMKNNDGSYILKTWRGDIVGAIENAIEQDDLTDQLVALAPMAGYDVWQHACTSFADQLIKQGRHLHASQYLVATNKIHEAITLLMDNKYYREAVSLARARLQENDQLVLKIVKTWAYRLKNGSSFEMAAKCFSSIGEYAAAASCLSERASSRRSAFNKDDLTSLFAASALAKLGEAADAQEYAKSAIASVLKRSGMWKEAQLASSGFDLTAYRLILATHETIVRLIDVTSPKQDLRLDELFSDLSWSDWWKTIDITGFYEES